MGVLILPLIILLSSLLIFMVLADKAILSDTISSQESKEHDLQEELLSLLEESVQQGGVSGLGRKRASHGKGPAPVTRVINQFKQSKNSERRRDSSRGSKSQGGRGAVEWDDDDDDDMVIEPSTSEPSTGGERAVTRSPRPRPKLVFPDTGRKVPGPYIIPTTSAAPSPAAVSPETPTPSSLIYESLTPRHLRLQKLDYYFAQLGVFSEDCRKRLLCEVAEDHATFQPLSFVLQEETSFAGEYQHVTSEMMNTTDGARLLSYMEATLNGQDRTRGCSVFNYRCPSAARDMINYDALVLWREMIRWLSVQVVARRSP